MIKGIGIDLGTAFSSVAVWADGRVEVIPNDNGNRSIPSFVAFSDGEFLLGEAAKNQVVINPTNTVFEIKRLLGRRYEDPEIQTDMQLWPFNIINICGKVMIEVNYKGKMEVFTPEEISAIILMKLKEAAESYLGLPIREAVITVPAYFNEIQREATKEAGLIAGLNVLRIVSEPTAAALAYRFQEFLKEEGNVFIFDLGGGTFDVSILSITGGSEFQVLATAGDTHLGGKDFDDRLVNYLIQEFNRKNKMDVTGNYRALHRIRFAAERAKRSLSSSTETVIEIDALLNGTDAYLKVTRAKFEFLCSDLFQRIIQAVKNVLEDAKFCVEDIQDVILVGGSTRIPKVRQILQKIFSDEKVLFPLNAEEAVVSGAAIQAAILCGERHSKIHNFLLVEITPLSLGIQTAGGVMTVIIQRGTQLPCQRTRIFTTFSDEQTAVTIQVFEGERSLTKNNYFLDTVTLCGIPLLPRGIPKIEVTFTVDIDGILHVEGKETSTGIMQKIKIEKKKSRRLKQSDIKKILSEAHKHRNDDENHRQRIESQNNLEKYVSQVKQALINFSKSLNRDDTLRIKRECDKCLMWLRENSGATVKAYEEKYNHLTLLCRRCCGESKEDIGKNNYNL